MIEKIDEKEKNGMKKHHLSREEMERLAYGAIQSAKRLGIPLKKKRKKVQSRER